MLDNSGHMKLEVQKVCLNETRGEKEAERGCSSLVPPRTFITGPDTASQHPSSSSCSPVLCQESPGVPSYRHDPHRVAGSRRNGQPAEACGNSSCWRYRQEGANSLVVDDPNDRLWVTCFQKIDSKKRDSETRESEVLRQLLEKTACYANSVIAPLLGPTLAVNLEVVRLEEEQLSGLLASLHQHRPAHRLRKRVDVGVPYALRMPDACYVAPLPTAAEGPAFCVEIKPKCGVVMTGMPEGQRSATLACRFCMKQKLTATGVQCNVWTEASTYCPMDLYSGCRSRMLHALRCMAACPRNNIRLFRNGRTVFSSEHRTPPPLAPFFPAASGSDGPEDLRGLEGVLEMTQEVLTTPLQEDWLLSSSGHPRSSPAPSCLYQNTCQEWCECRGRSALARGSILWRLQHLHSFCGLSLGELESLYSRLRRHDPAEGSGLCGPYDEGVWRNLGSNASGSSASYAASQLARFIVSRTMWDCSIMVSMQPLKLGSPIPSSLPPNQLVVRDARSRPYVCQVTVIDLDPKGERLEKYFRCEGEMVRKFEDLVLSRPEAGGL